MPRTADKVVIRRARLTDASVVAELSGQLGYPTSPEEMAARLAHLIRHPRFGSVLIAETSERRVIGWVHVSVTPLLEVSLRAEVNGLIVAEGQRSSGAGAKLLKAAEEWAKSKGCDSMSVRSNVIRDHAHAFYLRNGYEHYKTQKAFRKKL
jgi:GNAT superfamily N-acetyltransferase